MNKKSVIIGIALVIIIIGIIMTCTLGFNLSFRNGEYTAINIYINKEVNIDEIRTLVAENFDGIYRVEYIDEFSDTVSIKAKEMSDDKAKEIQDKIKEKYEFDEETERILVTKVPYIRVYDLAKNYVMPVVLSFIIVLAYYGIAFRKLGIYKSVIEPGIETILIGGVYTSILVICRIPLNEYIAPIGIFIYIVSLFRNYNLLKQKEQRNNRK